VLIRRPLSGRLFRPCLVAAVALLFEGGAPAYAQEDSIPPPWRLDLTAGVGYDDNIRFTPSAESSVSGRLRAGLTRLIRTPRLSLTLGAAGDGSVYRPFHDFNEFNYGAEVSASYLFSPRTTLRLSDSFSKSYTNDSRVLLEAGLLLPRTVARSNDAGIEVSHQISPRWAWTASGRDRFVRFDSNLLIDGSSLIARADLSFTPAPAFPLGFYYEFGRVTRDRRPSSDMHGATLWGERRFRGTMSLRVDVGAYKLVSQSVDASRVVPTGAATFAVRSTRQTVEAAAVRSVSEAFGLGRLQVRSAASLRYSRILNPWLSVGLSALLNRSEAPSGNERQAFDTLSLGGELGFTLAKDVEVRAAGGYRSLDPGAVGLTHSRFATLTLRVGQNW